jgi:hypothetical protein
MKKTILIISFLIGNFFLTKCTFSQSANGYFHSASNNYINNFIDKAKKDISTGLSLEPGNKKLNALAGKIKEEEKKQQQQQQQNQDQNQKDQQKDQEKQQQQQSEQEKKEQQDQQQQQQQQGEEKKMSKQDAERILNALQNDEKDMQKQRKVRATGEGHALKDW